MNRTRILAALFTLLICASVPLVASADDIVIQRFSSDITVEADGQVKIVETIDAFFNKEMHGLYRDIPLVYEKADGSRHYTSLNIVSVTDGEKDHQYDTSDNGTRMRLKIGDPDKTIEGAVRYVITYRATGVISSYESFDELYWNVTGSDWEQQIVSASATVTIPAEMTSYACYQGENGSNESCRSAAVSGSSVQFETTRELNSGEGLTIAVDFPKDTVPILFVAGPEPMDVVRELTNFAWSFGSIFLLSIIGAIILWWKYGRDRYLLRKSLHDPAGREVDRPIGAQENIVVEYESPAKLRPAQIGVLMDEKADTLDVTATIVDLAVRGYLTIAEVPKSWIFGSKDYKLTSTKRATHDLLEYEQMLLADLFKGRDEIAISDLKEEFYTSLAKVKKALYADVVAQKLFMADPEKIRTYYRVAGVIAIVFAGLSFFLIVGSANISGLLFGLATGGVFAGVLVIILAGYMPRRTAHGRELYRQSLGYKVFVSGTEKYRQPFFENQNIFMDVLPYAIVFGVTSQLAKAMKDMGIQPPTPSWYMGATAFNIATFSDSMSSFESSLSSAIAAAPSGSGGGGGGFSGGGFGGGGGGGW